jgi:hypothetical protein
MKKYLPLIIAITVIASWCLSMAGCGHSSTDTQPSSTTPDQIQQVKVQINTAIPHVEAAEKEVGAMPSQAHKEAALTHLAAADTALKNANGAADDAMDLAKDDAKKIAAAKDETANKIRLLAIPFLVGGALALAVGLWLKNKYVIAIGAGSLAAGALVLALAGILATLVKIATIALCGFGVICFAVAGVGVWHFIVYLRRGESPISAAENAIDDLTHAQMEPDKVTTTIEK